MDPIDQNTELPSENTDQAQSSPSPQANPKVEEVKDFIKTKFLSIVKKIIAQPIGGSFEIFVTPDKNKQTKALSLLGLGFVITLLLLYLGTPGNVRSYIEFSAFLKASLAVTVVLLLISIFSLLVKIISGVKTSFGDELLTGGICTIPLCLFFLLMFIISLFTNNNSFSYFGGDYSSILSGGSFIVLAAVIYLFLYLVTIVQQSLRASKVNDASSWYLSPLIIVLAFYIVGKIGAGMF